MWGFVAASVITVWAAVRLDDPVIRAGLAIVSPIVSAMVINTLYLRLRRQSEVA